MDELILRVLNGTATRFEEERLKRWRAESPENEARIRYLARLWVLTTPEDSAEMTSGEVERLAESITSTAEARREKDPQAHRRISERFPAKISVRTLAPWGAALAASAAALVLGFHSLDFGPDGTSTSPPTLSIAMSSQTLRLDDGSFVRLSPGSRLEARLSEGERLVTLVGRAFFAVAPERNRPFSVLLESGQIQVLGTRFEVAEEAGGIRTVVVEGRVALATAEGRVDVPGGSVGSAEAGMAPTVTAVEDVLSLLDWPGGLLVFHNTPLSDVAREVERHFRTPIRVVSATDGGRRVSASFEAGESFQEVMETLCSVTRSQCQISADSAVVEPATGEER
jgi:transmembrane sensor